MKLVRFEDLETRTIRGFDGNNTSELINNMGIEVDMVVPSKVDPGKKDLRVNLKIKSKESFDPILSDEEGNWERSFRSTL